MQPKQQEHRTRINHFIKAPKVKLILADGTFAGEMSTYEALRMAKEQGLDLVEINGKTFPPMVKLTDYGKFRYEEKKKAAEAKRKQFIPENKELFCHPNTDKADIDRQVKQAREFLLEGHRCRYTIKFRGREMSHLEVGEAKLNYILDSLADCITERPPIQVDGKNMSVYLLPNRSNK